MITALRIARIRTGMSLRDFARKVGIPETTLCKIEKGTHYVPPAWRPKLAEALGIRVGEMCNEDGLPLPEGVTCDEVNHG
jgi:DNA-binding XRE family transcriptional regulator